MNNCVSTENEPPRSFYEIIRGTVVQSRHGLQLKEIDYPVQAVVNGPGIGYARLKIGDASIDIHEWTLQDEPIQEMEWPQGRANFLPDS